MYIKVGIGHGYGGVSKSRKRSSRMIPQSIKAVRFLFNTLRSPQNSAQILPKHLSNFKEIWSIKLTVSRLESSRGIIIKHLIRYWIVSTISTLTPHTHMPIDLSHKSHNAPVPHHTMHHFVSEMCAHFCNTMVHFGIFVLCAVGFVGSILYKKAFSQEHVIGINNTSKSVSMKWKHIWRYQFLVGSPQLFIIP